MAMLHLSADWDASICLDSWLMVVVRIDSPQAVAGPIRCSRGEAKKSARQAVRRSGAKQVWG
ncbi:hypothetical protein J3F83DRAFT_720744 [Trichoderma novae-zelandiae]